MRLVARHAELPQPEQERVAAWRVVPRAQRRPLTVWDGPELLRQRLVLWLDGWQDMPGPRSIEPQLARVRALWRRAEGLDRPPWLRAIGALPMPRPRWVVTQPSSITELAHDRRGRCVRARVELTLLEWVDPEVELRVARPRRIARRRTHVWQRGDTIRKLARRYLGGGDRWVDIRAANPRIRAWSRVRPGTVIVIPHR